VKAREEVPVAAAPDHPAHRKVALLAGVLLVLTAVVGTVGVFSVRAMQHDQNAFLEHDGRILTELGTVQQLALRTQLALEQAAAAAPAEREPVLERYQQAFDATIGQWDGTSNDPDAPALRTDIATFGAWVDATSAARRTLESGAVDVDLSETRPAFDAFIAALDSDIAPLNERVTARADRALDRADLENRLMIAVVIVGLIGGGLVSHSTYRAARAQHIKIARSDRQRALEAARQTVQAEVSQALEFARDDADALHAAELALQQLHPERPTELLLADSSRAHFEVGLRSSPDDDLPGCRVPTPSACPAVAKGQSLLFADSERFDACPFLRERPAGPLSAICIPVSISGTAEGVLHSTGPHREVIAPETRHTLEYIANRSGDRIGVLRAFSRSEAQAATDPLTGLANRRSFENHVGALLRRGTHVTIAFGDIDHFKQLNDAHGHDVGDRALRTFSRAFSDAVRPGDLIARWGGEEFVVAFPDTTVESAIGVLERLQQSLAALVSAGVVPAFTVSFGVADRYDGDDLEAIVAAADAALLQAKAAGRNCIVRATGVGGALAAPDSPRPPAGVTDLGRHESAVRPAV
jgi:diguanylate cyclase (GGDEF)-like protein